MSYGCKEVRCPPLAVIESPTPVPGGTKSESSLARAFELDIGALISSLIFFTLSAPGPLAVLGYWPIDCF